MKRKIINIDEDRCTGCGECLPDCPEGALRIIDGKARLISDLFCDGLGACIGSCPEGAISVEEREAEPYDEEKVMDNIIKSGPNTIKAHLEHLLEHGEEGLYNQAVSVLEDRGIEVPRLEGGGCSTPGCPGMKEMTIERKESGVDGKSLSRSPVSRLSQWPVQLHLLNPEAGYLDGADLLISADCAPFAYADFHERFMKGRKVINFCPKLDKDIGRYVEKLTSIFKNKKIKSVTIVRMEVPCCGGIEAIVKEAIERAGKAMMVKVHVVSISGDII